MYQNVMSLWHQLHVNMKSVVSWHYLLKDIRTVSEWTLDTVSVCLCHVGVSFLVVSFSHGLLACLAYQVRRQSPSERQHILDHLESQLTDFLSDSKESPLFTAAERRELDRDVQQALQHCQDLLVNMESGEMPTHK